MTQNVVVIIFFSKFMSNIGVRVKTNHEVLLITRFKEW